MRNEKLFVILWQNYNIMEIYQYTTEAVELLKRLIATPSISREESTAADTNTPDKSIKYRREMKC